MKPTNEFRKQGGESSGERSQDGQLTIDEHPQ